MESNAAIVLFDLALVVPPLVVLVGFLLLALPSRARRDARTATLPHAA